MSKEILGVSISNLIAVAGVAAVAVIGTQMYASSAVSNEAIFINQLANDAHSYASSDPDATNITSANLIAARRVPTNRLNSNGIIGKWAGTLSVVPNAINAANDSFAISETVPSKECEMLVKQVEPSAHFIVIGGTAVKTFAGGMVANWATQVTTLCNAQAQQLISFGYLK